MDKNLTVYPIASGNMLNVFAGDVIESIRILDMHGNEVYSSAVAKETNTQVSIDMLENATYIVEAQYADKKTARSVFVKL